AFGGDAGLTFDKATQVFTAVGVTFDGSNGVVSSDGVSWQIENANHFYLISGGSATVTDPLLINGGFMMGIDQTLAPNLAMVTAPFLIGEDSAISTINDATDQILNFTEIFGFANNIVGDFTSVTPGGTLRGALAFGYSHTITLDDESNIASVVVGQRNVSSYRDTTLIGANLTAAAKEDTWIGNALGRAYFIGAPLLVDSQGDVTLSQLTAPGVSVTRIGATGATTCKYQVVAKTIHGYAAGAETTRTNCNATLD